MEKFLKLINGVVFLVVILTILVSTQFASLAVEYGNSLNFKYGDLNGDMKINSIDMALLRKYLLGMINELPSEYPDAGKFFSDVNADGTINSMDLGYLRQYLLGMIDKLPAQDIVVPTNNIFYFQNEEFTLFGRIYKVNGEMFINPAVFNANPGFLTSTSSYELPPSIVTLNRSEGPRVTFFLDVNTVKVDGREYTISTAPIGYKGSTLLPLKVITDIYGYDLYITETGAGKSVNEFSLESNMNCRIDVAPFF